MRFQFVRVVGAFAGAAAMFAGCAGVEVTNDGGTTPLSCPRYQEAVDGACRPVEVVDIEERPLDFSRKGIILHGTLTLPVTKGTYRPPIFVLAHGSGPNDRDQNAPGALGVNYGELVPTFKLLAEGLARHGVAVYRYDKRTCFVENSHGRCPNRFADYPDPDGILVDDFIEDHRAAVRAVAALEEVDGSDVTVLGLSKGANYVPRLFDEQGVIAGVQMAGSALPVDETMVRQLREFADYIQGMGPAAAEQAKALRAMADKYEAGFSAIRAGTFEGDSFEGGSIAYWRNWMALTDAIEEDFKAVEAPILVLQGEVDFNVPTYHFERFQTWADEAGMENATFSLFPHTTHTFVRLAPDGRGIEERFSSEVLQAIVDWHRSLVR